MVDLICYLVAVILWVVAAFNVPARFNLIAAGLAFFAFPLLLDAIQAVG